MDFDADMAAAIAASIKSSRKEKGGHKVTLSRTYLKQRSAVSRKGHHPMPTIEGDLRQINTFNQFHSVFDELVRKHQAPSAICGYVSMAAGTVLASLVQPGGLASQAELDSVVKHLRDYKALMPGIKHAMQFVQQSRRQYVDSHRHKFRTHRQLSNYMSAWVANYEISDYFRHVGLKARAAVDGIVFARFNQYSEREHATHQEKERILKEEAPFGGGATHDKGEVTKFEKGVSVFIMEHFAPHRKLLRPEQFLTDAPSRPRVFVLDLNGHFCVAVPASIKGRKQLVLLNTTESSYLHGAGALVASMAFDISFAMCEKSRTITPLDTPAVCVDLTGEKSSATHPHTSVVSKFIDLT